MIRLAEIADFLEGFAPRRLAASWDNVGLLVGDLQRPIERIMTCLTVTPASAAEAIRERADLIVTHHPLPFRPLAQITTATTAGMLLLGLIERRISIYSPHTAFDSAKAGMNQRLAELLGLVGIEPLLPAPGDPDGLGSGRRGELPEPILLRQLAERLKAGLRIGGLQFVGDERQTVRRVAVACGSAGEFLDAARAAGCEAFVLGETNFHTCLEAEARGIGLLLPGHFASERFGVEFLAERLGEQFRAAAVWASRDEADPLRWLN